ncbi:GlxA family transcriptional regulator [Ectothiorhodospiraceae bacterium WFHF3C12]|nr:GlxA family transcriptional regulator [Ectothiorhodospiraceae bacterium WFHF3C12]
MEQSPVTKAPHWFTFVLVPNYSMIAFSSALEPLRMANQLSGRWLYTWEVLTYDGQPVAASNGIKLQPDRAARDAEDLERIFVCAGNGIENDISPRLPAWLRTQHRHGATIGGVCTGSYLLAVAGLLDGVRCTVHWEYIAGMRERFPRTLVRDELFIIDQGRYTCAGGSAPLDMMLHIIAQQHGRALAADISEEFSYERIRDDRDRQRVPLKTRVGAHHDKLLSAVALMEANIEEPIALDELARYAGLSRRQLERLFDKHLGCVPTRYYLQLRLHRARQLLTQTNLSVAEIGSACGFVSAPHFSRCYRHVHGIAPREERLRARPMEGTRSAKDRTPDQTPPPEQTGTDTIPAEA